MRRTRGFTLIEVLVALAVVAIALSATIRAAGQNADNAAYLRDRSLATWVAINTFNEWRVLQTWPDPGEQSGDAWMGERQWHWRARVQKTSDAELRRVDIAVAPDADTPALAHYSGFLGRPFKP